MIGFAKIASLSAVLAAGLVTAYEAPKASASSKIFTDRLPQADVTATGSVTTAAAVATAPAVRVIRVASGEQTQVQKAAKSDSLRDGCAGQHWPYISRECLTVEGAPVRKPARTITIERRDGADASTLIRMPASAVASR